MQTICFFLGGFQGNGGIGRVTSMLAGLLADSQHFRVITLSYADNGQPSLYPISEKIQQHFFLDSYQSMTHTLLSGGERKLRTFLKDNQVDVLIACGALFFPLAVRACKGTQTKSICWEHTDPNTSNDYRFQRFARSYGANRARCNVVLTKRAEHFYREHFPKGKTVQIYNPLDSKVLAKAGEYDPSVQKIISVGRLSYPKNFQLAIRIASEILPSHPQWHWDIYGEGEDRRELEQLIIKAGLQRQMHLRGQVDDLYDRYKQYSFMVMTSRYEGFPMTLLEGIGNGLPLVSFDINTGPDEIIQDGQNGYLVEAFDEEIMKKHILQLMEDVTLRQEMSRKAKHLCADFSQEEITQQWVRLLASLR